MRSAKTARTRTAAREVDRVHHFNETSKSGVVHAPRRSLRPIPKVVRRADYQLYAGDCLAWMAIREPNSIHAIVTDPPYGLREYTEPEKEKLRRGRGGVWRIPPSFDGH